MRYIVIAREAGSDLGPYMKSVDPILQKIMKHPCSTEKITVRAVSTFLSFPSCAKRMKSGNRTAVYLGMDSNPVERGIKREIRQNSR